MYNLLRPGRQGLDQHLNKSGGKAGCGVQKLVGIDEQFMNFTVPPFAVVHSNNIASVTYLHEGTNPNGCVFYRDQHLNNLCIVRQKVFLSSEGQTNRPDSMDSTSGR